MGGWLDLRGQMPSGMPRHRSGIVIRDVPSPAQMHVVQEPH